MFLNVFLKTSHNSNAHTISTSLLVDSGSQSNFMNLATYLKLGPKKPKLKPIKDFQVTGCVAYSELDLAGSAQILVKMGKRHHLIKFYIVKNLLLGSILGERWLRAAHTSTDFNSLTFLDTGENLPLCYQNSNRKMKSCNTVTIQPGKHAYVSCISRKKTKFKGSHLAHPVQKYQNCTSTTLVDLEGGRKCDILLANGSNKPMTINKGETLAEIGPVGENDILCYFQESSTENCSSIYEIHSDQPKKFKRKSKTRTPRKIPTHSEDIDIPPENITDRELVIKNLNLTPNILSKQEENELIDLLVEKIDAFNLRKPIGRSKTYEHDVPILSSARSFYQRPYSLSEHEINLITKEIQKLEDLKLVARGAPYPHKGVDFVSACFLCAKASSASRFVLDTRMANHFCASKKMPSNNLNDLIRRLGRLKPKYFCSLDLFSSYFQLPISEESKSLMQFCHPATGQRYHFVVCPMGYLNAAQSLQSCLGQLFDHIPDLLTYADDALLAILNFKSGMTTLREILDIMIEDGMIFNMKKCVFFTETAHFVGQEITRGVFRCLKKHTDSVKNLTPPKSIPELRRLIGSVAWLQQFIRSYSLELAPLYDLLTKKHTKFEWKPCHQEVFLKIKEYMMKLPCLKIPSFSPKDYLILGVDSSTNGMGACLYQAIHDDQDIPQLHLLGYCSKMFKSSPRKSWSSFDNELQGLRLSLKFFHALVYGSQQCHVLMDNSGVCDVLSGHKAVKSIRTKNALADILDYSFKINYVPGESHTVPDFLSRIHDQGVENNDLLRQNKPPKGVPNELDFIKGKPDFSNNAMLPTDPDEIANMNMSTRSKSKDTPTAKPPPKTVTPKPKPSTSPNVKPTPDPKKTPPPPSNSATKPTTSSALKTRPQTQKSVQIATPEIQKKSHKETTPKQQTGPTLVTQGTNTPPDTENEHTLRRSRRQQLIIPEFDKDALENIKRLNKQKRQKSVTKSTGVSTLSTTPTPTPTLADAIQPIRNTPPNIQDRTEFPPLGVPIPSDESSRTLQRNKIVQEIKDSQPVNPTIAPPEGGHTDNPDFGKGKLDLGSPEETSPGMDEIEGDEWLAPYVSDEPGPLFDKNQLNIKGDFHFTVPPAVRTRIKNVLHARFHNKLSKELLLQEQAQDPYYRDLIKYFLHRVLPRNKIAAQRVLSMEPNYIIVNGCLFRVESAKKLGEGDLNFFKIVVPSSLRYFFIKQFHQEFCGHMRFAKTYSKINKNYYIFNLAKHLKAFLLRCHRCAKLRKFSEQGKALRSTAGVNCNRPMQFLQSDFSKLPINHPRYTHFCLVVDEFSGFTWGLLCNNENSITMANFLASIMRENGYTKNISTDRGAAYRSNLAQDLSKLLGYKHFYSAGHNARACGMVESKNKWVKSLLKHAQIDANSSDLPKNFSDCLVTLNTAIDEESGTSPFERVKGYTYRTPLDSILEVDDVIDNDVPPTLLELRQRHQLRRSLQVKHLQMRRAQQKFTHDTNLDKLEDFKVGDYVYLKTDKHKDSPSNNRKGALKKCGPFKIVSLTQNNAILCDFKGSIGKNEFSIHNLEPCGPLPDNSFHFDEFLGAIRVKNREPKFRGGKRIFLYYPIDKENKPIKRAGFWA